MSEARAGYAALACVDYGIGTDRRFDVRTDELARLDAAGVTAEF
jgi:hypothetical protein